MHINLISKQRKSFPTAETLNETLRFFRSILSLSINIRVDGRK